MDMKQQRFGIEVELTGITVEAAQGSTVGNLSAPWGALLKGFSEDEAVTAVLPVRQFVENRHTVRISDRHGTNLRTLSRHGLPVSSPVCPGPATVGPPAGPR